MIKLKGYITRGRDERGQKVFVAIVPSAGIRIVHPSAHEARVQAIEQAREFVAIYNRYGAGIRSDSAPVNCADAHVPTVDELGGMSPFFKIKIKDVHTSHTPA